MSSQKKLVVASAVKTFIKENEGLNTSASCLAELSNCVERECRKAAENARKNKRKTVLDRDFREENY